MKRHPAIPQERWTEVKRRLDAIERDQECRILFAVESGSRAWGFPSPDSDYDVRFVYAKPTDWYLTVFPGGDVIETPVEDDMDVNGWDLRKALHLVLKSNAVISEWMESPILYRRDAGALKQLRRFADRMLHPRALTYHYLHLARRQVAAKLGRDQIVLKRYFYALRPALALRFLRLRQGQRPPMNLQALMDGTDLPAATVRTIEKLRAGRGKWARAPASRRSTGWSPRKLPRQPARSPMRRDARALISRRQTGCFAGSFAHSRDMFDLAPP